MSICPTCYQSQEPASQGLEIKHHGACGKEEATRSWVSLSTSADRAVSFILRTDMMSRGLSAVRLEVGDAPPIDPPSPKLYENVNSEADTRVGVGAEIASISVGSNIDPTVHDTHVVTGTDLDPSTDRDSRQAGQGSGSSDRLLFDFRGFLEGGALNDTFGISPEDTPMPTPGSAPGDCKWGVTRLSGGLVNVTVRAHARCGDCKSRSSVIIKYAPDFVAAIGEDAPFGTFRQVGTISHFHHEPSSPQSTPLNPLNIRLLPPLYPQF